uniref:Uncharacterized protein n=1 Tax=Erwinia amylovora ATCC BAA-2158 TaxID=889211 RepID=E5B8A8_ERWAM|nr:hypothetical protein predicted by Glimmer/Critica [Erwinia amylovora ATCC BAA-2158]
MQHQHGGKPASMIFYPGFCEGFFASGGVRYEVLVL